MAWRTHLPEGWTITRYLGSEKTSNVYEVDRGGGNGCVALKVFKRGYAEHGDDARYLNELQGVDGVSRVIECSTEGSMLVMEPVGEAFEASAIGQDLPLADLVDVLHNAHVQNIVNRDKRQENIMVAKSLKTGKLGLFIHDWGSLKRLIASLDIFVEVFYLHLMMCFNTKVSNLRLDVEAVLNFWLMLESGLLWQAALEAATNVDDIVLKAAFKIIEDVTQAIISLIAAIVGGTTATY
ncbi:hypothetical protein L7F22_028074 [Adiantum nelumboides]|nr:hypothetical protein [Adiantum nelumboides]